MALTSKKNKAVSLAAYQNKGFDVLQLGEIKLGLEHKVDVSKYADPAYLSPQMAEIRKGLESGVDISLFSDRDYDWFQMEEIRKGLESDVDVNVYRDKSNDYMLMREIRKGLVEGINLMPFALQGYRKAILRELRKAYVAGINIDSYVNEGYSDDQIEEIRLGIMSHIDISDYLNRIMSGSQMREIRLGLEKQLDVSTYNDITYNWMQMREIRLGLEKDLDVYWYSNVNFSARQMREIRLGLEDKLSVFTYAIQIWSATDMHRMRMNLLHPDEASNSIPKLDGEIDYSMDELTEEMDRVLGMVSDSEPEDLCFVEISEDKMEASLISMGGYSGKLDKEDIYRMLADKNVKQGIDAALIEEIIDGGHNGEDRIVIARGTKSKPGQDGYYNFMFKTALPTIPKILDDDSVDYMNVDFFEPVSAGQKLAVYNPATSGVYGCDVLGKLIAPVQGKNLPRLTGNGFKLLDDGVTYMSNMDGRIEYDEYRIKISAIYYVPGNVTASVGNIRFKGDIHIAGYVGAGVTIEAQGDIVIDGNVEAANIKAGHNVLIRSGVCAADKGVIQAGNNVYGKYFEKVKIIADNDIESNYILNCECIAMNKVIVSGKKGAIVGGAIYAVLGVEASSIGNAAEIKTYCELGANRYYTQKLKEYLDTESQINKEAMVLTEEMKKFKKNRKEEELSSLTIYQNIEATIMKKLEALEAVRKEKNDFMRNKEKQNDLISVKAYEAAYGGCVIKIDDIALSLDKKVNRVMFRQKNHKICSFNLVGSR